MKGFWPAFLVGLPLGALVAGALGTVAVQKKVKQAREGWALVPVLVALEDLEEGTALTVEQVGQRAIPESFVVATMVRPDEASWVVGQRLTAPLLAGDPVLWTSFVDHSRARRVEACVGGIKPRVAPQVDVAEAALREAKRWFEHEPPLQAR